MRTTQMTIQSYNALPAIYRRTVEGQSQVFINKEWRIVRFVKQ